METLLPFEREEDQIVVKKSAETSSKFGKPPEDMEIDELLDYGVVNIDKPAGPTSHQTSAYTKKILGLNKTGHSGTLDPKVTGCLIVALGKATRIVHSLLNAGKEYVCLMHLHKEVDKKALDAVLKAFVGKIKQLPPIKSSVKRAWRFRKIYYIKVLERQDQDVLFLVGCQAGTYIRKLVHDIGQELGCGAHMAELRRTKVGPFNEASLLTTLQDLTDAFYYYTEENDAKFLKKIIMPVESAVAHLKKIWVLDTTVDALCHGATLKAPGVSKLNTEIQVDDPVALMSLKGELIAVGRAVMTTKEILKAEKGVAAKSSQVFMNPGVYPRIDK